MTTQNTKVVPAELDGIPIEVATSMLLAPRARLTARMRKNCQAARCKVYPSVAPIVIVPESDEEGEGEGKGKREYLMGAKIDTEVKIERLARGLKWVQLHSHLKRMTKRRTKLQKEYIKLMHSDVSDAVKQSQGRLLTWAAGRIELAQDALSAEIKRREKITALGRV